MRVAVGGELLRSPLLLRLLARPRLVSALVLSSTGRDPSAGSPWESGRDNPARDQSAVTAFQERVSRTKTEVAAASRGSGCLRNSFQLLPGCRIFVEGEVATYAGFRALRKSARDSHRRRPPRPPPMHNRCPSNWAALLRLSPRQRSRRASEPWSRDPSRAPARAESCTAGRGGLRLRRVTFGQAALGGRYPGTSPVAGTSRFDVSWSTSSLSISRCRRRETSVA